MPNLKDYKPVKKNHKPLTIGGRATLIPPGGGDRQVLREIAIDDHLNKLANTLLAELTTGDMTYAEALMADAMDSSTK